MTLQEKHPELYLPEQNINRRTCERVVPMEALNLSMCRTGTQSMQFALNLLGIPCYHSMLMFSNTLDCKMWDEALDAKFFGKGKPFARADWDQLLGNYSAVSDVPATAFAEELVEIYPEAKVILVERDVESWYKSFNETVIWDLYSWPMYLGAKLDPFFLRPNRETHHRWRRGWLKVQSKKELQEKARSKYQEHYAHVRRVTPKERLLEYRLGSGWGPLCEFLGKPIPDVPFPRVNDGNSYKEKMTLVARRGLKNAVRRVLAILVPLFVFVFAWWFSRIVNLL